jgi:20S proteasome subunit beta 7
MQQIRQSEPIKHVTDPIVTGSSIIALKFDKGVVLACDNLLSYGSTLSIICIHLEFKFVNRIEPIAKHMVIAATGEYADFQ